MDYQNETLPALDAGGYPQFTCPCCGTTFLASAGDKTDATNASELEQGVQIMSFYHEDIELDTAFRAGYTRRRMSIPDASVPIERANVLLAAQAAGQEARRLDALLERGYQTMKHELVEPQGLHGHEKVTISLRYDAIDAVKYLL